VLLGWTTFGGGLQSVGKLSAAHLAPAEQGERPWRALCGASRTGRGAKRDTPAMVKRELERGDRKLCARCQRAAT
jgi:hypothetical protein